tara:strand:- start:19501 stop:20016 length:516 start_codon:yes stop_codon:yes gene_type:complete
MRELSDSAARSIMKPAAKAGMSIVNKAARANAKDLYDYDHNNISKSIGVKDVLYKRSGTVVVMVGPRANYFDNATGHRPSNTAHLVELGTKSHDIRVKSAATLSNIDSGVGDGTDIVAFGKKVTHPGTLGKPFLRPALDDSHSAVSAKVKQVIRKKLDQRTKRAARKAKAK